MREYYAYERHPFDEPAARRAMGEFVSERALGRAWLIGDGTASVGYIVLTLGYSLEYHGVDAFIDEFFIEEGHRRRGWGRRCLEHVEAAARGLGVQVIHLEVLRENRSAQEFYRKMGFKDQDRYLMTKRVEPKDATEQNP